MVKKESTIRVVQAFRGWDITDISQLQATNDINKMRLLINQNKLIQNKSITKLSDGYVKAYKRLANQYVNLMSNPNPKEVKLINKKFGVNIVNNDFRWNIGQIKNTGYTGLFTPNLPKEDLIILGLTGKIPVKKGLKYITSFQIKNWNKDRPLIDFIVENINLNSNMLDNIGYGKYKILLKFETELGKDKWSSSQTFQLGNMMDGFDFLELYEREVISKHYYDFERVNSKNSNGLKMKIKRVNEVQIVFYS